MEFTIESLQGKIPASVYELLTSEDYMNLPLPEEGDIDKAYAVIVPPDIPCHWSPVSQRPLVQEELSAIKECTVIESNLGQSVCFLLGKEKHSVIPCYSPSPFKVGQKVNPETLTLIELRKFGEDASIWRVAPNTEHIKLKEYSYMPVEEYNMRTETFGKILKRYNGLLSRDGKKINIFKYLRLY